MSYSAEVIKLHTEENEVIKADTENGYTRCANDLLDYMCALSISGRQNRVLQSVIRLTLGYNCLTRRLNAQDIAAQMKYEKALTHISADIRELKDRRVLLRADSDKNQLGVNLTVSEWVLEKPLLQKNRKRSVIEPKTVTTQKNRKRSLKEPKTVRNVTENGQQCDRNQSDINKDNNKDNIKDIKKQSAQQLIDYLNKVTGRCFTLSKAHLGFISARLDEGLSLEDLKLVVDHKAHAWLENEKMCEYLRPQTLFNSKKCAGYLASARYWVKARGNRQISNDFVAPTVLPGMEG